MYADFWNPFLYYSACSRNKNQLNALYLHYPRNVLSVFFCTLVGSAIIRAATINTYAAVFSCKYSSSGAISLKARQCTTIINTYRLGIITIEIKRVTGCSRGRSAVDERHKCSRHTRRCRTRPINQNYID